MINFLKSLFMPPPASGALAKERLRLVLLSDHLSLAPDVVDALKRDLLEVISRYVEIDSANADVTFEHREREVAMLASIPITGVRERPLAAEAGDSASGDVAAHAATTDASADEAAPPSQPQGETADERQPEASQSEPAQPAALEAASPSDAGVQTQASTPRRRRRKKARALAQQLGRPAQA